MTTNNNDEIIKFLDENIKKLNELNLNLKNGNNILQDTSNYMYQRLMEVKEQITILEHKPLNKMSSKENEGLKSVIKLLKEREESFLKSINDIKVAYDNVIIALQNISAIEIAQQKEWNYYNELKYN